MKSKFNVKQLTLLAMLVAVLLLMAFTPLGYLNIGLLAITFNVIPVAIGAIALGPAGGLIAGSVFGLTSFLQCIGIGGLSPLGSTLFSINPFFTIVLCFVPRMLDGFLLGYIFRIVGRFNRTAACFVTGFFAAFLNTAFYMSALVLLFGRTEYLQGPHKRPEHSGFHLRLCRRQRHFRDALLNDHHGRGGHRAVQGKACARSAEICKKFRKIREIKHYGSRH